MSGFLSHEELVDLTGLVQGAAQIRWLRKEKIRVRVRADGKPRVLWDDVKSGAQARAPAKQTQPNFEALHVAR